MKVILQQDVDHLGIAGEEVEVSHGYARNYLIPMRLAVKATKGARRSIELRRESLRRREEAQRDAAMGSLEKLKQVSLVIRHKAGMDGKLHGSVTAQDIADAIREKSDLVVEKRQIDLFEPIRATGSYLVTVRLFRDVEAQLPVKVISDAPSADAEAEAWAAPPEADEPDSDAEEEEPEEKTEVESEAQETEDSEAEAKE